MDLYGPVLPMADEPGIGWLKALLSAWLHRPRVGNRSLSHGVTFSPAATRQARYGAKTMGTVLRKKMQVARSWFVAGRTCPPD